MLAAARRRGLPLEGYLSPDHPVQRAILEHAARLSGVPASEFVVGVDGCGAPAFAIPLTAIARSIARLVAPDGLPPALRAAATRVRDAMLAHPEMVAGEGRFDTDLMRAGNGRVLAKAGAEGVHVAAVPDRGLALAVKVDDGSDRGYRAVVIEELARLGAISADDAGSLRKKHAPEEVRSLAGAPAGRLETVS
jgi:L-asparaginase II